MKDSAYYGQVHMLRGSRMNKISLIKRNRNDQKKDRNNKKKNRK